MKTTPFEEIKRLAQQDYPETRIGMAHLLSAWANHDPGGHFNKMLADTGMSNRDLILALVPLIQVPQPEDFKIVTLCLLDRTSSGVRGADLVETIVKNPTFRISRMLFHGGLDFKRLIENLNELRADSIGDVSGPDNIAVEESYLENYSRNLNKLALSGCFDDLIGREKEVKAVSNIMLRQKKSNVILTGKPGIGKTVIVRLLAKSISQGDAPVGLKNAVILELDIPGIVAGTMYRGQFEERLKKIVSAVITLDRQVILFMDEIHMIVGAGSASNVNTDGANILKPYLSDKNFSVIGATTADEYHRFIAKDKAFARRFEYFPVTEPDKALTNKIVSFQASRLADYHGIEIREEIVKEAIDLTTLHIPNRCQPDKSIDLLDISCAAEKTEDGKQVTRQRLLAECARITGRDIEYLSSAGRARILNLEGVINRELIGQEENVSKVCDTIIYRRLGVGHRDRPIGVFMLCGNSGVGKTTLAQLLARRFYGNPDALLYVDMAEYCEAGSLSKLVGTAPGYVGHENSPGQLVRWVRRNGSGVILMDEIEKAHPDVCQALLGLLDNGRVTGSTGETMDAKQCIIIATTNAVNDKHLNNSRIGFGKMDPDTIDISATLRKCFSLEFLNRFDELLLFKNLGADEYRKIISLRLKEAEHRFLKKNIHVKADWHKLAKFILDKVNSSNSGARGINKILEREFLLPVSKAIFSASRINHIEVNVTDQFYTDAILTITPVEKC